MASGHPAIYPDVIKVGIGKLQSPEVYDGLCALYRPTVPFDSNFVIVGPERV